VLGSTQRPQRKDKRGTRPSASLRDASRKYTKVLEKHEKNLNKMKWQRTQIHVDKGKFSKETLNKILLS
jgi:hypothetical protein